MSIKTFKPTTPSRRQMTVSGFDGIDKKARPEPSLTEPLKKSSGRNSYGRITVRHRGGGNKRKYRIIDFKRDKMGSATVLRLEYDPNRSANIALIEYEDGEKRYILAPVGLKAGHKIMTGPDADILPGNALPIANIPVGTVIHITERAMAGAADKKYVFEVAKSAGKVEIKKAVEEIFGVKVASVNTLNVQAKAKRMGAGRPGTTRAWKKAYVTLTADSKTIEFFEGMV